MTSVSTSGFAKRAAVPPSPWINRREVVFVRKFVNSFIPHLEPRYLFAKDKDAIVSANIIWTDGDQHKTEWYAEVEGSGPTALAEALLRNTSPDDSILDMCCNQGRFLRYLWQHGYRRLFGFDIMAPAVEHFRKRFGDEMPEIRIDLADARDYLRSQKNGSVDYLTTYSATLELIHPRNNVVQHMGRIARKGAILALHENAHAYPRFWRHEFRRAGFHIVEAKPLGQLTLFVLRKNGSASSV